MGRCACAETDWKPMIIPSYDPSAILPSSVQNPAQNDPSESNALAALVDRLNVEQRLAFDIVSQHAADHGTSASKQLLMKLMALVPERAP